MTGLIKILAVLHYVGEELASIFLVTITNVTSLVFLSWWGPGKFNIILSPVCDYSTSGINVSSWIGINWCMFGNRAVPYDMGSILSFPGIIDSMKTWNIQSTMILTHHLYFNRMWNNSLTAQAVYFRHPADVFIIHKFALVLLSP